MTMGTWAFDNGNFVLRVGPETEAGSYTVVANFIPLNFSAPHIPNQTYEFRVIGNTLTMLGVEDFGDLTFIRQ